MNTFGRPLFTDWKKHVLEVPIPFKTFLDSLHTRMQALTELVSESLQITKTHVSQPPQPAPNQDSTVVSEIEAAVDRIDAYVK